VAGSTKTEKRRKIKKPKKGGTRGGSYSKVSKKTGYNYVFLKDDKARGKEKQSQRQESGWKGTGRANPASRVSDLGTWQRTFHVMVST